jgi:hypothetical protein
MSDDEWLFRLAQMKSEEQDAERTRLDERWDRLSAGELSPEEEAELRRLAETSEEARDAYEAFRPLGPEFQARVVRAIQEQSPAPEASREVDTAPSKQPAKRWSFPWHPWRFAGWSAAAATAALALLLRLPVAPPPMPGYVAELSGGIQAMRGDQPGQTPTFSQGSRFELVARPETAVSGPVETRYFLGRGDTLSPWSAPEVITTDGSVRIAGTVGREILIPPGEWTLFVVVGRPGRLPDAAELRALHFRPPPGKRDWVIRDKPLKAD